MTTISRMRKREGIQEAVLVLVPIPALVLPAATGATQKCRLYKKVVFSFFIHPPTSDKRRKEKAGDELYAV